MTEGNKRAVVLIPAYKPDERLIALTKELIDNKLDVLLVDDGGGETFRPIFDACRELGAEVAVHAVNMGKGRALKTGINAAMLKWQDMAGIVTADADGQHTPKDILRLIDALHQHPDKLVLGSRAFTGNVPKKSLGQQDHPRGLCAGQRREGRRYADGSARAAGFLSGGDGAHRRRTLRVRNERAAQAARHGPGRL